MDAIDRRNHLRQDEDECGVRKRVTYRFTVRGEADDMVRRAFDRAKEIGGTDSLDDAFEGILIEWLIMTEEVEGKRWPKTAEELVEYASHDLGLEIRIVRSCETTREGSHG